MRAAALQAGEGRGNVVLAEKKETLSFSSIFFLTYNIHRIIHIFPRVSLFNNRAFLYRFPSFHPSLPLSSQAHYDFGLRNILSVLRTAGTSKRTNPDRSETYLMMRTLRDMNMSKFVAEDVPLFLSLIEDLFPGLKAERAQFPDIQAALEKTALARGLQCHPNWLNKCIQVQQRQLFFLFT